MPTETDAPKIETLNVARELLEEAITASQLDRHALRTDLKPSDGDKVCVGLVHKKDREVDVFTAALAARMEQLTLADLEAMKTQETIFYDVKITFWPGIRSVVPMVPDLPFSEVVTTGVKALDRYRQDPTNGRSLREEVRTVLAVVPEPIAARAGFTSYWEPSEDGEWEHFVCEICGNVEKLPWNEKHGTGPLHMPWCHHGDNYTWMHGDIEKMHRWSEQGWVPMKRAEVRVRASGS